MSSAVSRCVVNHGFDEEKITFHGVMSKSLLLVSMFLSTHSWGYSRITDIVGIDYTKIN